MDTLAPVPYLAQQPAGAVAKGKIHYFGGGFPNSGTPLKEHYVYDPGSDSWSKVADIPVNRVIHETGTIHDSIYVMGGQPDKLRFERYSVDQDSWRSLGDLPDPHFWYGTIVTLNDTMYRFGGGGYLAPQKDAQRYDLENDNWIDLTDMPDGLHALAGAAIGDSIYLVGGFNTQSTVEDKVWIYNTRTDQYHEGYNLPKPRNYHEVVGIGNCIYALGGQDLTVDKSIIRHCLGDTAIDITGIGSNKKELTEIYGYYNNGSIILNLGQEIASNMQVTFFTIDGRIIHEEMIQIGSKTEYKFNINALRSTDQLLIVQIKGAELFEVLKIPLANQD